jgi:hypothetical protein
MLPERYAAAGKCIAVLEIDDKKTYRHVMAE